jgi:hypothetical protein
MKTSVTKVSLSVLMSLILCLGVFASFASAYEYPEEWDDEYAGGVAITKLLAVPTGTSITESDFEFQFKIEPVSWEDDTDAVTDMPTFPNVTLDFSLKADASGWTSPATNPYTAGGLDYYVLESEDILQTLDFSPLGSDPDQGWLGGGKYKYQITEITGTTTFTDNPDYDENMTYSDEVYYLYIFVGEDATEEELCIVNVGAAKFVEGDPGAEPPTTDEENKISVITPGGGGAGLTTYEFSQITFQNNYWKTATGDPQDPDPDEASLVISASVAGAAATDDVYFKFALTLSPPSIIPSAMRPASGYYAAFVVDSDGDIIDTLTTANVNLSLVGSNGTEDFIKFNFGVPTDFSLKAGEKLIFLDTPVGSSYRLDESGTHWYTASYSITTGGVVGDVDFGITGAALSTFSKGHLQYTGEGYGLLDNLAAFTNTCDSNPESGLGNKPLYGLSILAVFACAAYVVGKTRKKRKA